MQVRLAEYVGRRFLADLLAGELDAVLIALVLAEELDLLEAEQRLPQPVAVVPLCLN